MISPTSLFIAAAQGSIVTFAAISFVSFLCAVGLLMLMLKRADLLARFGLIGNLYYIVLLPLGFASAAFLFGILHSYAEYKGQQMGGTLELGGPIVGFLLVVLLGFWLPKPQPVSFDVTVFVHGEASPSDLVLRNTGEVWMTLGQDRRHERIGDKGQADFKDIVPTFRGQEVSIWVEAGGYETVVPDTKHRLDGDSLTISVRRKSARWGGRVQNADGLPVPNAIVRIGEFKAKVDEGGHFLINVPGSQARDQMMLEINAPGYQAWREKVPPAEDMAIILQRAH